MLSQPPPDENTVQTRVNQRLNRLKRVFVHLVVTLVLCALLSLLNLQVDILIPAVVLIFVAHALWVVYQEGRATIIQQETDHARQGGPVPLAEKPKREQHFSLKDDGELVEITDEESAELHDGSSRRSR